jgi:hypothetical protein
MNADDSFDDKQDRLLKCIDEVRAEVDLGLSIAQDAEKSYLASILGSDWERLLSTHTRHDLFVHSDPKYRQAGIYLCCYYEPSFPVSSFVSLLNTEIDPQVKAELLCAIGHRCSSSNNDAIVKLMIATLLDESQPQRCREAAYVGLLDVVGRLETSCSPVYGPAWFPEGVDWDLVRSLGR